MSGSNPVFALNEAIVQAVARLVDDAGATREPSHSDLEEVFRRVGLEAADPRQDLAVRVGKQKRVRQVLRWAMDNDQDAGTNTICDLVGMVRAFGGFRPESPNFCGEDAIANCMHAFDDEPVELTSDGLLRPRRLEAMSGRNLTEALRSYVSRAQGGYEDSVLVAGTSKDLIEATAAHVLTERYGTCSADNFMTLLGQAFVSVGLTPRAPREDLRGLDGARVAMEVSLFELGCAVNRLRNRAGSGHGRAFVPELSVAEVRAATEAAGLVAGRMLDALEGC